MASTINATTSGIVNIGDSVATLALQTGGTTAVAIDTAQIVTLSKSLALLGSTSGSVTIAAPAVAGSTTLTLPATSGTLLQSGTAVTVAQGGTGLTAGTSGGVPYFSGTTTVASSAALTANGVVYGGGAGAAPVATAAGTTGQFLGANTGAAPTWQTPAGGSPGGSTTQVQYNNAGAFGGISGFTTDGTRVTASTTIGVGGATPSTSGSGITFPATQSASTDVNTLDDYEEGTWTPSLGGTTTYASRTGDYVKIGRLVFVSMNIQVTAIGTGSTTVITGLPFTPSGSGQTMGLSVGIYQALASNVVSVQPYIASGTSSITMYSALAAGAANAQNNVFQNSARIDITGYYITT
jgi:hypothetical protein